MENKQDDQMVMDYITDLESQVYKLTQQVEKIEKQIQKLISQNNKM